MADKLLGMKLDIKVIPGMPEDTITIILPRPITPSMRQELLHEMVARINTLSNPKGKRG